MSRKQRAAQTLVLVIFTGIFIIGNVLFARSMFGQLEERLLTETGTMYLSVPETYRNEDGWSGTAGMEYALSQEELSDILTYWGQGTGTALHEPMKEQMSMEQAITVGQEWIYVMLDMDSGLRQSIEPCFLGEEGQLEINATVAMLFSRTTEEEGSDLMLPYYGYWRVSFRNNNGEIRLLMNAVTGQVWHVVVIVNNPDRVAPAVSEAGLRAFAEMAGITDPGIYDQEETAAYLYFEDAAVNEIYVRGSSHQTNYRYFGDADYDAAGTEGVEAVETGTLVYSYELGVVTEYDSAASSQSVGD